MQDVVKQGMVGTQANIDVLMQLADEKKEFADTFSNLGDIKDPEFMRLKIIERQI